MTKKEKRLEVKEGLKKLAVEIRTAKATVRRMQKEGHDNCSEFWNAEGDKYKKRIEFRHKHIAYCLLKGRTLEQIEQHNRLDNKPNRRLIGKYFEEFGGADD